MNEFGLIAALLAGVLGAGHCIAMCGTLAAGPRAPRAAEGSAGASCGSCNWRSTLAARLFYNAGRVTTYVVAGILAGASGAVVGASADTIASLLVTGMPVGMAVRTLSALVLVLVGMRLLLGWHWLRFPEQMAMRVFARVVPRWSSRLESTPTASGSEPGASKALAAPWRHFALGMLWGWLPCGLSYSMLLIAFASADALSGGALMLAFGVGTLPALLGIGLVGGLASTLRGNGGAASVVTGWAMVMLGTFVLATTSTPLIAMARSGAADAAPPALPPAWGAPALPGIGPEGPMCHPQSSLPY